MHITESKTLLAKLMATENLTVEQRNVQTASFNVKDRVLTLPILDAKISSFLYDMFLGHEVGHALHTPLEGFQKAKDAGVSASVANVIEDSRIERRIKTKYPGIRTSFVKGYRELIEKDFFGTKGADLNDFNFIDRVNLYTKGGAAQGIIFNEFEKRLVDKIESTETYEDVIAVGIEVMAYMKEEAETAKKLKLALQEDEDDSDEDGIEIDADGYDDSDEWDDETEERETSKPFDGSPDEETEEESDDEREHILRLLATGLEGKALEKIIIWNSGGRNGKGLLNDLFLNALGNYGMIGNNSLLTDKSRLGAQPELANIDGKRYVVFREVPETSKFENSEVKELTGGGTICAINLNKHTIPKTLN